MVPLSAGRIYDLATAYPTAGDPGAGSTAGFISSVYAGTAGTAVVKDRSSLGAIDAGPDLSPSQKFLLAVEVISCSTNGLVQFNIVDVLLYYPALVLTGTPTALTNGVSLSRYTDGEGVMAYLVADGTLGAGLPAMTFTYTNHAGTGSRAAQVVGVDNTQGCPILLHAEHWLTLQSGDRGIRSVESYTIDSGGATGTATLVLCRPIASFQIATPLSRDFLFGGSRPLPEILDGACLNLLVRAAANTSTTPTFEGGLMIGWV